MEPFAIGLFAVAVIGIPIAILLFNDYGKKRGAAGAAPPAETGISATGRRKIPNKEVQSMGTEKERKDTQKAVLYDLRRLLKNSGKDTYSVDELCDLLDTIADAKDQE